MGAVVVHGAQDVVFVVCGGLKLPRHAATVARSAGPGAAVAESAPADGDGPAAAGTPTGTPAEESASGLSPDRVATLQEMGTIDYAGRAVSDIGVPLLAALLLCYWNSFAVHRPSDQW
ncbi:hypothetical protein [Streptomyces milbemycinicus]|uniref:hypothetical protein n=1 Tax=Streptomyces milbemycinicus TaxID=476552 RepID=UPI0033CBE12A